ncbi:MAG TPA: L-type lectin-domain containing protein [Phycisphaerales bacterium]|nr:L-type lectin-domain containing protein [Phycisphaerales bacterium]
MPSLSIARTPRRPATAAISAAALAAITGAAHADFSYPDFAAASGLSLVGAANTTGSSLSIAPAQHRVAGAVWHQQKQAVANGFETTFSVRITGLQGDGADGLALVLQNQSATALGGTGGAMGYAENHVFAQPGIAGALAIELDLWNNAPAGDWNDPDSSHVSLQSRGPLLEASPDHTHSLAWNHLAADLSDGALHVVSISYVPGILSVYVDDLNNPVLSANVDLASLIALDAGRAWVGLTAATGGASDVQGHEITGWTFTTVPAPGPAALLGLGGLLASRRRRPN